MVDTDFERNVITVGAGDVTQHILRVLQESGIDTTFLTQPPTPSVFKCDGRCSTGLDEYQQGERCVLCEHVPISAKVFETKYTPTLIEVRHGKTFAKKKIEQQYLVKPKIN
jgi:hypothetical protein